MSVYSYLDICIMLAFGGLFAGFLGPFFGFGGGVILVPILLAVFSKAGFSYSVDMHFAIGTALFLATINAAVASYKHYHSSHNMPINFLSGWAIYLAIGASIGSYIAIYTSSYTLKIMFTVFLVLILLQQIYKRFITARQGKELDSKKVGLPTGTKKNLAAMLIGGLSVMIGVSGGTFTTPFLTHCNYPIRKAMIVSLAGGFVIGMIGSIAAIIIGYEHHDTTLPWSVGYVNFLAVIVVTPFIIIASPYGIKANRKVRTRVLNLLYMLFFATLIAYMIYTIVKHVY